MYNNKFLTITMKRNYFFKPIYVELFAVGLPRMYFYRPQQFCLEPIYFNTILNIFLLFPWRRGQEEKQGEGGEIGAQKRQEKRAELYKNQDKIGWEVIGTESITL